MMVISSISNITLNDIWADIQSEYPDFPDIRPTLIISTKHFDFILKIRKSFITIGLPPRYH
jgi:hypothetical protein